MVAGQEPRHLDPPGSGRPPVRQQVPQEQVGRRPGCACARRRPSATACAASAEHVDRPGPASRPSTRAAAVAQEHQPLDRGRRVPAEPGDVARPLAQRGERRGCRRPALSTTQTGVVRPTAAAIGTTRAVLVGRPQRDLAVASRRRPRHVAGPALGHDGGPHRPAQRVAGLAQPIAGPQCSSTRSDSPGTTSRPGPRRRAPARPCRAGAPPRRSPRRSARAGPYSRRSAATSGGVAAGRDPPVHLLTAGALLAAPRRRTAAARR